MKEKQSDWKNTANNLVHGLLGWALARWDGGGCGCEIHPIPTENISLPWRWVVGGSKFGDVRVGGAERVVQGESTRMFSITFLMKCIELTFSLSSITTSLPQSTHSTHATLPAIACHVTLSTTINVIDFFLVRVHKDQGAPACGVLMIEWVCCKHGCEPVKG